MEGTHGQLGTRLADGLCCDDTDRFADLPTGVPDCQVGAVAVRADAACVARHSQHGADLNAGRCRRSTTASASASVISLPFGDENFAGLRIDDIVNRVAAEQTLARAAR